MKNYVSEFIGTFFLVLTIGLTAPTNPNFAPLAIGAALMVMVYMSGHVSGGHLNPAVTLAVLLRGRIDVGNAIAYMISQLIGAVAAAEVVLFLTATYFGPAPGNVEALQGPILVELLFTFALALVVLNSATAKGTENNSFYGLAIGMTVMVGAFAGGGISGGAFNPAVGLGPNIVRALQNGDGISHVWIYIVGPFAGAALAAATFKLQHPGE